MELTCPKCHASMRQYERNGVTIDQCSECRGIFLDRGELEHLLDAESKFYSQGAPIAPAAPPGPAGPYPENWAGARSGRGYGSPGSPDSPNFRQYGDHYPGQSGQPYRKRRSFLSELFD